MTTMGTSTMSMSKLHTVSNDIKLSSNALLINELRSSRCNRVTVSQIGSAFDGAELDMGALPVGAGSRDTYSP